MNPGRDNSNARTRRKARRAAMRYHQSTFAERVKACIEMIPGIWWHPL